LSIQAADIGGNHIAYGIDNQLHLFFSAVCQSSSLNNAIEL
jgi:hypothetical protein